MVSVGGSYICETVIFLSSHNVLKNNRLRRFRMIDYYLFVFKMNHHDSANCT